MKQNLKGSATIETAYIMPLVFLVFTVVVYMSFYYHDKNILTGAAYETTAAGSEKLREEDGCTAQELEHFFKKRVNGKLILFAGYTVSVKITDTDVLAKAKASKRKMSVSVMVKGKITRPEQVIRDKRKLRFAIEKVSDHIK